MIQGGRRSAPWLGPRGDARMLSILGRPGRLCDGRSRRELLQIGTLGLFGLGLPQLLKGRAVAREEAAGEPAARERRPRLRSGAVRHLAVPPGRPEPHRPLGSQAGRPVVDPRRVPRDRHERAGGLPRRGPAAAGPACRQVRPGPLARLQPQGAGQPRRGDLHAADRPRPDQLHPHRAGRAAVARRPPFRRLGGREVPPLRGRGPQLRRALQSGEGKRVHRSRPVRRPAGERLRPLHEVRRPHRHAPARGVHAAAGRDPGPAPGAARPPRGRLGRATTSAPRTSTRSTAGRSR